MADPITSAISQFGKSGLPIVLLVGGLVVNLVAGAFGKWGAPLSAAGFIGMGAGMALFISNSGGFNIGAKATFPVTTDIETKRFANPVNNLSSVPKRNRFDLQTNYILGAPDTNEEYMNDLILNEVKSLGMGAAQGYPVKMNPWEVKTLIPTTQVEPSRDFNTVKMVMA